MFLFVIASTPSILRASFILHRSRTSGFHIQSKLMPTHLIPGRSATYPPHVPSSVERTSSGRSSYNTSAPSRSDMRKRDARLWAPTLHPSPRILTPMGQRVLSPQHLPPALVLVQSHTCRQAVARLLQMVPQCGHLRAPAGYCHRLTRRRVSRAGFQVTSSQVRNLLGVRPRPRRRYNRR